MIVRDLTIQNRLGLHARAAARFVSEAQKFGSEVKVTRADTTANGKSIMSMMLLAASINTVIRVSAEGDDEVEALNAIEQLLADKFGEED